MQSNMEELCPNYKHLKVGDKFIYMDLRKESQ